MNSKTSFAKGQLKTDDFIKMMLTQLQHQDPLEPAKNQELLATIRFGKGRRKINRPLLALLRQRSACCLFPSHRVEHRSKLVVIGLKCRGTAQSERPRFVSEPPSPYRRHDIV